MLFRCYIIFTAFLSMLIVNPAWTAQLLSHNAIYALNIERINKNSSLEGGQGRSVFKIKQVCNGWDVNEDYILIYELANNKNAKSFSSHKTFENTNGTQHSFEHNEKSDFNGENNYEGFIQKINNKIIGSLISKRSKDLSFDQDVLFPVDHLKKLIDIAKNKGSVFTSKVFFGSENKKFIKIVSAFINKKRNSNIKNNIYLSTKMVWPIKLAFYSNDTKQSKPDYEITVELDDAGIVHSYEVNYGDFVVKANLQKFKIIEKSDCK